MWVLDGVTIRKKWIVTNRQGREIGAWIEAVAVERRRCGARL
jgi:hypothetical protein